MEYSRAARHGGLHLTRISLFASRNAVSLSSSGGSPRGQHPHIVRTMSIRCRPRGAVSFELHEDGPREDISSRRGNRRSPQPLNHRTLRNCLRRHPNLARYICQIMTGNDTLGGADADPAAIFACALSTWRAIHARAEIEALDLSDIYNGIDQLMREVMRVACDFEGWACQHVAFDQLAEVWPYLLEYKFGPAILAVVPPDALTSFDDGGCLRVALGLCLPVIHDGLTRVPISVDASNPVTGSAYAALRVATVRDRLDRHEAEPFTPADDPLSSAFGPPFFALYGLPKTGGTPEHICNRPTYAEAVAVARNLAPGIRFPSAPTSPLRAVHR
jgi:hypothetical protein